MRRIPVSGTFLQREPLNDAALASRAGRSSVGEISIFDPYEAPCRFRRRAGHAVASPKRSCSAAAIGSLWRALSQGSVQRSLFGPKDHKGLIADGIKHIAVIGDLNDTPDSAPLRPLVQGTDLKDIFTHPQFDDGGYPGTYGLCNAANKIDYIFLSPALYKQVKKGGVFRTGMWPGSKPKRWDCYEEVTRPEEAASDHAAVWADIDI